MNTTEKTNISTELRAKLNSAKETFVPARSSTLPIGKVEEILEAIKKHFQLSTTDEAITVVAILFQQGGTARSCHGDMATSLFGKSFKLSEIRKILKQNSCKNSERKLARSLANEIFEICNIMELSGNLSAKIQKSNLEKSFQPEELIWMSDFQAENPTCPFEIRTYILESFKKKNNKRK